MNFVWPGTVRRFAALSVAAAAVLGGVALTASPAHASTAICLDANAQQAYDFGAVIQFQCNDSDNFQNWTTTEVGGADGGYLVRLQNNGTGYCLDADAGDIGDFGEVIQWQCSSSDNYQLWILHPTSSGAIFESYGAWLQGESYCLDADAQQTYDYGSIIQWQCNTSDPYQNWFGQSTDGDVLQNVGA
jgi:hypothetical protein